MKTLVLVNPAHQLKPNLATILRLPSASLAYLAALTPADWEIKLIDENTEPLTYDGADLVAITSYTCNAPRGYEISQEYRRRGVKTVMGGVHVSLMSSEASEYVDSVAIGEGESIWAQVISDFENGSLKPVYQGDRLSLDSLPRPNRTIYGKRYRLASVETSRGCPNDCEFCSVTTFNGHTYRQRPVDEVLAELEGLTGKYFFFSDDNILGYGHKAEDRAIRLFRGMIDRGLKKRWAAYVGIDFVNNPEVVEYARKAGCLGVFIGFESIDEESLKGMHKVRNLRMGVARYKDVVKILHGHGIGVLGSFVLGSDTDDKDVFDRTTEFVLDSRMDAAQFSILNPFPGTRLYDRLMREGRLLRTDYPSDWKHYDFTEALFQPRNMTPEELEEGVARMYKNTTSRATSAKRALVSAIQTRSPFGAVVAYLGNRGAGDLWEKRYAGKIGS